VSRMTPNIPVPLVMWDCRPPGARYRRPLRQPDLPTRMSRLTRTRCAPGLATSSGDGAVRGGQNLIHARHTEFGTSSTQNEIDEAYMARSPGASDPCSSTGSGLDSLVFLLTGRGSPAQGLTRIDSKRCFPSEFWPSSELARSTRFPIDGNAAPNFTRIAILGRDPFRGALDEVVQNEKVGIGASSVAPTSARRKRQKVPNYVFVSDSESRGYADPEQLTPASPS